MFDTWPSGLQGFDLRPFRPSGSTSIAEAWKNGLKRKYGRFGKDGRKIDFKALFFPLTVGSTTKGVKVAQIETV